MKKYIPQLLLFVVGLVLGLLLLRGCQKTTPAPIHINYLDTVIKQKVANIAKVIKDAKVKQAFTDSLLAIKPKVVHHYHEVYDSVYMAATDSCKPLLETVHKEHAKVDSINTSIINSQTATITDLETAVHDYADLELFNAYKLKLSRDSTAQCMAYNKVLKRKVTIAKGVGWGKTLLAAIGGLFIGKAAK